MTIELSKLKQCPSCGSENIIYDKSKDEIICKDCRDIFSEMSKEEEEKFEKASDII